MSSVLFIVLVHLVVINSLDVVLSVFIFYGYGDHRDLHVLTHSFPTRRSSDLYKLPPRFASRACRGGSRMIRFVIGVIRLYFGLGVIFGTIVFGSILYQYFAMERVKESLGTVIGDALLAAFFRFLLWAPQLWQALMYANRSFVDWLLLTGFVQ